MARLSKADLAQMNEGYFQSLELERLVEVTKNLYELAVEQLEKLEESSRTSSRPPSSDSPYGSSQSIDSAEATEAPLVDSAPDPESEAEDPESEAKEAEAIVKSKGFGARRPG